MARHLRPSSWLGLTLLLACATEDQRDPLDGSATVAEAGVSPEVDDGAVLDPCAPPAPDPSWLGDELEDVLMRLTGAAEIDDGVTIRERETLGSRQFVRELLAQRFADSAYDAQLHVYSESGANVWATLPATDGSTSWTIVGAHYDTVADSPGANDNATGVAVVMALARHMREVACRDENLLFVLFDEEELGRVGSAAFVSLLGEQGAEVTDVHTIDQVGWDADGDRIVELERPAEGLLELYQTVSEAHGLGIQFTSTDTGQTDYVSFTEAGFAAVGVTEEFATGDTTAHRHEPTDTYDTIDLDYTLSIARLLLHVLIDRVASTR